ncbi:MAG: hypothetical protein QOD61_1061 [Solirubrobacteraceae bacterium]|nr:hypothetical protein [Solirubrobacteraceae bacterium]MEA2354932.1 hypothetical protein [Solirubrobacteraceae bacterium]
MGIRTRPHPPAPYAHPVPAMRLAAFGLLIAAILFLASGGHLLFLPLFFVLPLGGLLGGRRGRRRTRRW